jgi:hypothetical protein
VAAYERQTGAIYALGELPDGRLASADDDGTILLWDWKKRQVLKTLNGRKGAINALAVLRDGRLASGGKDKTIRVWDPDSGYEVDRVEGGLWSINALSILNDGHLAAAGEEQTIRIWDIENRRQVACLKGHTDRIRALGVLPNGRLASGANDMTIRIWDLQSEREVACLEVDAPVTSLAIARDGIRLAIGDEIGQLHWLTIKEAKLCGPPRPRLELSAIVSNDLRKFEGSQYIAPSEFAPLPSPYNFSTVQSKAPEKSLITVKVLLAIALLVLLSSGVAIATIWDAKFVFLEHVIP